MLRRFLPLAVLVPAALAAQQRPRTTPPKVTPSKTTAATHAAAADLATMFDDAVMAWDKGSYVQAIDGFAKVLGAADAAKYRDSIALITGELYHTTELTTDGTRPGFSLDGRYLAYESGVDSLRVTRVVSIADPTRTLLELPGTGASFSATGAFVAYTKGGRAFVRDLRNGADIATLGGTGTYVVSAVFGADDNTLFLVAGKEGDPKNDILRAARTASGFELGRPVSSGDGFKSLPVPARGGRYLLHALPATSPIRAAGAPAGGRGAAPGGGATARPMFAVVDLSNGNTRRIEGMSPALSADGSTLVYLVRAPGQPGNTGTGPGAPASGATGVETSIMALSLSGGDPVVVKKAATPIEAPALSPDGKRIAFQMMTVYDQDIYLIDRDGKNEARLTRDIQHDLLPRFLDADRLLAVQGEARHRRSFVYDLKTLARTRLFDNNSVRTIAPEYEWSASPDGTKIAIVAERDGNTVSPDRGVYLTDLARQVTIAEVAERLKANRAAEVSLRERGIASFRPIAAEVKAIADRIEVSHIYRYEKSMFDFDSKHVTQPGNAKVIQYLVDTYKSFGYEPELQWFEPQGRGMPPGLRSANVLAVLKGTVNPELVYVVSSHFDSRAEGPGADDDASGTAALLEAARALAKHPLPATVIFASFTGEEAGLLGSREFVRRAVADKVKVVGALNNDMVGWANDFRLDNTIRYSNPGIRDIQHAAAMQFSNLITYDALYYKSTDAQAYYDAYGDIVGGIGSYPVLGNPHYHMPHDALEVENHQLVAEVSKTTVATIMLLASSPSRLKELKVTKLTGRVADLSWAPSPEKGVKQYLVTFGPAFDPARQRVVTTQPRVQLQGVEPGMVVQVKAVNARGLEGWDWARVTLPER